MEILEVKCKNCEGELDIHSAENGVLTCPYCRSKMILPKSYTSTLSKLQEGEQNLDTYHFDDAYINFQKATEIDPTGPEGYFGMALATAKVQYLKDVANGEDGIKFKYQPICYDVSDKKFTQDSNYLKAMELASPEQRVIYKAKAEEIDYIRSKFFELKNSGLEYDTFICVKVTTEEGNHTEDSTIASKLYYELKKLGYKPFYSEEEMSGQVGADYEARILYALYCAQSMIIVCTNEAYLQTIWVRNEYSRYSHMLSEGEKESESITFVFKGKPVEKLPNVKGKIQGIDFNNYKALQQVLEFVDKFTSSKIPSIKRKDYDGTQIKKKALKRQTIKKRDLGNLEGKQATISELTMLKNAEDLLKSGDFAHAKSFCANILKKNPNLSKAYLISFFADNQCKGEEDFINIPEVIDYSNFEKAIATSDKDDDTLYKMLEKRVRERNILADYEEYISLPDSSENNIIYLTNLMFKTALLSRNKEIFDSIIRTVKDTETYLNMNLFFAGVLPLEERAKYYENILSVDPSNQEALYEIFKIRNGLTTDELVYEFCSKEENQEALEKQLFSYGYNSLADNRLEEIALNQKSETNGRDIDKSCNIFDFLLSMIPKKDNELFKEKANKIIDYLYDFGDYDSRLYYRKNKIGEIEGAEAKEYFKEDFDKIIKYANLILTIDPLDHNTYFTRFLARHKITTQSDLLKLADDLLDDEDYFEAMSCYTEKNPDKDNYYLELKKIISDCASIDKNNNQYWFNFPRFNRNDLLTDLKNSYKSGLDSFFQSLKGNFAKNYNLNLERDVMQITQELQDLANQFKDYIAEVNGKNRIIEFNCPKNPTQNIDRYIGMAKSTQISYWEESLSEIKKCENEYFSEEFTKKKKKAEKKNKKEDKKSYSRGIGDTGWSRVVDFLKAIAIPFVMLWKGLKYIFGKEGWGENRPQRFILIPASLGLSIGIFVSMICALCGKCDFWIVYAIGLDGSKWILLLPIVVFGLGIISTILSCCVYYFDADFILLEYISFLAPFIVPVLAVICLGITPAVQRQVYTGDGYYLRISSGTVETCYTTKDVEIVIPEKHNGYIVVEIGSNCFRDNDQIIKVTLPQGLEEIGFNAFNYCDKLTDVVFTDKSSTWYVNEGWSKKSFGVSNSADIAYQLTKGAYASYKWYKTK